MISIGCNSAQDARIGEIYLLYRTKIRFNRNVINQTMVQVFTFPFIDVSICQTSEKGRDFNREKETERESGKGKTRQKDRMRQEERETK